MIHHLWFINSSSFAFSAFSQDFPEIFPGIENSAKKVFPGTSAQREKTHRVKRKSGKAEKRKNGKTENKHYGKIEK